MSFIDYQRAKITIRQMPFDKLRWLVAALTQGKLHLSKAAFHTFGLAVTEYHIAAVIHQVGELIDIIGQHITQHILTKGGNQAFCRLVTNGRELL